MRSAALLVAALSAAASAGAEESSVCFGTPERGRLEHAVRLPASGENFSAYSLLGVGLGRTHVHTTVRDIVVEAYAELARELPERRFVYGETSWADGGDFAPHKTHQNGTTVDFMAPVLDASGASVPLPSSPFNKFGYELEFDAQGRAGELSIDFDAVTAHVFHLERAAAARGVKLRRVIFAPELRAKLAGTKHWAEVSARVPFSTKRPCVRHDEHYHVDFPVKCEPL